MEVSEVFIILTAAGSKFCYSPTRSCEKSQSVKLGLLWGNGLESYDKAKCMLVYKWKRHGEAECEYFFVKLGICLVTCMIALFCIN